MEMGLDALGGDDPRCYMVQRVEVYSKIAGGTWLYTYLDLDGRFRGYEYVA